MKKQLLLTFIFITLLAPLAKSQSGTKDDVLLFQSFFRDAPVHTTLYGQGLISYDAYDRVDVLGLTAYLGIPITRDMELGTGLNYQNISYNGDWDDETGIADIPVFWRYNFHNERNTKFSGGAMLTLPVGTEDIGYGNVDFGIFGAVRHAISNPVVLTGTLGINFLERWGGRETSMNLGAGVIYQTSRDFHLIGELVLETETDYAILNAGADYRISNDLRFRGSLGIGMNDYSPDFQLAAGLLLYF